MYGCKPVCFGDVQQPREPPMNNGPNFADLQREHDAASVSLNLVFGDEYATLWSTSDAVNVRKDFIRFAREGGTASQYRDRIGKGNLLSHAKTLRERTE